MKHISAIVLAAGSAQRFGSEKILQELPNGKSILRHIAEVLLQADFLNPVIVTRDRLDTLRRALNGLSFTWVSNPLTDQGMSTSLQKGIQSISPDADAALVVLADQPFLTPDLVHQLTQRYQETGSQIVFPVVQGQRSNPVVLDRSVFGAVMELRGDVGARALPDVFSVSKLDWPDTRLPLDVDTPQDYQRVLDVWNKAE